MPSSLVQSTAISESLLPLLSGQVGWRQQDALIYLYTFNRLNRITSQKTTCSIRILLLEITFMKIVMMMNIEAPATNI